MGFLCFGSSNMAVKMTIVSVNELSQEAFIERFANVVEMTPLCPASVCSKRPFESLDKLYFALCEFIDALPSNGREGILRSHPDLAGRSAKKNELTAESKQEQAKAGLGNLTVQEANILDSSNQSYRVKFGFPFVICARDNKKEAIMNGLKTRIENDQETELKTGIQEVKKIMLLRLKDLVEDKKSKL
jgi:2-oxo-4-hydroxy-4-carboxy-5-ureidoimidazoline decarboxylase